VANFMLFVAEEVRTILAALGYRSLDEICGRKDLLKPRRESNIRSHLPQPAAVVQSSTKKHDEQKRLMKTDFVDLSRFFSTEAPNEDFRKSWVDVARDSSAHSNGPCLEEDVLADRNIKKVIESNTGVAETSLAITNLDRSFGGRIAGAIAKQYGDDKFRGSLKLTLRGAAGQSFGVWNAQGVDLKIIGELNDYVGKGMSGGKIVAVPPDNSTFDANLNVIAGNTCLYGATGGEVFLAGRAGERFGVRNSGCRAVIEGAGDHLGEYMTGGVIVVLGQTGRNVGAGMSSGLLYVYDPSNELLQMHSDNANNVFRVTTAEGETQLRELIEAHENLTGSTQAALILRDWSQNVGKFWQVAPPAMQSTELVGAPLEIETEESVASSDVSLATKPVAFAP